MNIIVLERFAYSNDGTFGYLELPNGEVLCTVERPWLNNQKSISCIPVGEYQCVPRRYNRGGYDAVEVVDVPNRSYILFHKGNFVRNSRGCILVNSSHGGNYTDWFGVDSKNAFDIFMKYSEGFILKIINREGGIL